MPRSHNHITRYPIYFPVSNSHITQSHNHITRSPNHIPRPLFTFQGPIITFQAPIITLGGTLFTFEIASGLFWRPEKASSFRFGKIAFSPQNRFLSGSEKSLFQVAKTLEIASRLYWRPQKASLFRFGKIASLREKVICFTFEKIPFSGRQNARNSIRVVLAPR